MGPATPTRAARLALAARPCRPRPPSSPLLAPPPPKRPAFVAPASNDRSAPINAAAERLASLAADAQKAAQQYVRDNGLDQKAAAAAKDATAAATAAAEAAAQQMRTARMKLDREHDLSTRLARLKKRAEEAVADADASWGVRRRARSFADTARRRFPALKSEAKLFFATPLGQACAVGGLVVLIASGALWSLLSLLWVLWWFAIPVNLFLAERKRQGARRQAQAQADRAAQQAAGGGFWGAFGGGGGGGGAGGQQRARAATSGASGDRGPVIDAEYTTLWDEGKEGKKKNKG